jgi:predicted membrane-bound mannosyltransferase
MFNGPWTFNMDAKLRKTIELKEGKLLEFNMVAVNVLNHATFWVDDQVTGNLSINSTTFGVIGSSFYTPRVTEFGLRLTF